MPHSSPATTLTSCASSWPALGPTSGNTSRLWRCLSTPQLDPKRTGQTAARLFYIYAETLLALGRNREALQWFINAAAADLEGLTDAEDRITELG